MPPPLRLRQISVSSKIVGGLVGVATGIASHSPFIGAALSPFIAHNLERLGKEVIARNLTPRQEARVARVIVVAASKIGKRQAAGAIPRTDGFFDVDSTTDRSQADEATEAILNAAVRMAEERKLDYIASLLCNAVFEAVANAEAIHFMIGIAESLTYRQLVLLRAIGGGELRILPVRGGEDVPGPPSRLQPLIAEVVDMHRRSLVDMKDADIAKDSYAVFGVEEIDPCKLYLTPLGKQLYRMMELSGMSSEETICKQVVSDLTDFSGYGQGITTIVDSGSY